MYIYGQTPSLCKSVQGQYGVKDLTWAKVGEMFLSRNDFGKLLDIS
jgi:hypothetical protein